MPDDLQTIYGELAAKVPTEPEEELVFTEDLLPIPPAQLSTDKLYIEKQICWYNNYYAVDMLSFNAYHSTYRHLALLILSAMFHNKQVPIRLDFTHPASNIKHLMLEYNYKDFDWRGFYYAQPLRLHYHPTSYEESARWRNDHWDDKITFRLSNLEDMVLSEEQYQQRDTIWLYGNDRAYALFSQFLLEIGRPEETHGIHRIEGSGEIGSFLDRWSAEAQFILPGLAWSEDQWRPMSENQV